MKYLLTTLTTIMAFGLLTVSMPVYSQTPDGQTPAEEVVCDPLMEDGVTKGRILANYNKKKQDGDPDMPCILVQESGDEIAAIDGIMWDGFDTPGTICNRPSM
jgi:hypothetical protein